MNTRLELVKITNNNSHTNYQYRILAEDKMYSLWQKLFLKNKYKQWNTCIFNDRNSEFVGEGYCSKLALGKPFIVISKPINPEYDYRLIKTSNIIAIECVGMNSVKIFTKCDSFEIVYTGLILV